MLACNISILQKKNLYCINCKERLEKGNKKCMKQCAECRNVRIGRNVDFDLVIEICVKQENLVGKTSGFMEDKRCEQKNCV